MEYFVSIAIPNKNVLPNIQIYIITQFIDILSWNWAPGDMENHNDDGLIMIGPSLMIIFLGIFQFRDDL